LVVTGKQRNVADIMQELEELQQKVGETGQTGKHLNQSPRSNRSSKFNCAVWLLSPISWYRTPCW